MAEKNLVSVIMPCYNASAYLNDAIKSVLNQTHQHLEFIIVNDGSIDDSETIIKGYHDDRIRYFHQKNKGQCVASNFGFSLANGEYIKFFDADDVMNNTHIECMLAKINGSNTAVASCAWANFYDDDISKAQFTPELNWQDMDPIKWIKTSMSSLYDMMPAWLWLIPRQVLEKAGGWDERLSLNNDFEFSIRLLIQASAVHFAADAKMYYRCGQQTSLSRIVSEKACRAAFLSAKLGCSYLLKIESSEAMRLLCANKFSFLLFQVYPYYSGLVKELEEEIELLGGTNRKIDESPLMHRLQQLLGWKAAKRFKMLMYRLGYKKYLLVIKKKLFPPSISHH